MSMALVVFASNFIAPTAATLHKIRSLGSIHYLQRDLYRREIGCVKKFLTEERLCKYIYTISDVEQDDFLDRN